MIANEVHTLNKVLQIFGIKIGLQSFSGYLEINDTKINIHSGNILSHFPENNYLVYANVKDDYSILVKN